MKIGEGFVGLCAKSYFRIGNKRPASIFASKTFGLLSLGAWRYPRNTKLVLSARITWTILSDTSHEAHETASASTESTLLGLANSVPMFLRSSATATGDILSSSSLLLGDMLQRCSARYISLCSSKSRVLQPIIHLSPVSRLLSDTC